MHLQLSPISEDLNKRGNGDSKNWATAGEALAIICRPHNLKNTIEIALIVGTVLFAINQLDVVIGGGATWFVWFKVGLTYIVPFIVSNAGILSITKRKRNEA